LQRECEELATDLFHVRYSEASSKAIIDTARRLGAKVVFTIAPDPHRNLAKLFSMSSLDSSSQHKFPC
jgi:D-inositol-3-phosphate glycosyltransferase